MGSVESRSGENEFLDYQMDMIVTELQVDLPKIAKGSLRVSLKKKQI